MNIAIIGAGSWGTALALQLCKNDHMVQLWDIDSDHIAKLREDRTNSHHLPGISLLRSSYGKRYSRIAPYSDASLRAARISPASF